MSISDRHKFEIARKMPSEVLAAAAIDQARNFMLSEAEALKIAEEFGFAAEVARTRRLLVSKIQEKYKTNHFSDSESRE